MSVATQISALPVAPSFTGSELIPASIVGAITGITAASSAVVTINTASISNPFSIGLGVLFSSVGGMTQINGLTAVVSAIGGASGAWTITVPINSSGFSAFTVGGEITATVAVASSGVAPYKRTPAEISASVTPINYTDSPRPEIDVARYGVSPDGSDCSAGLADAQAVAVFLGGATLLFGPGTFRFNSAITLYAYVNFRGAGKYATTFDFHIVNGGTNIGVNGRGSGTGGFPSDRKIFQIRDLTFDFTNSGNQIKGLALGWNMRSMPLLYSVRIRKTADWGVGFLDQNWNIDFVDVEMDTCGTIVNNSCGWYKDPAVDGGTFNYINWYNCITEGCGSASSAAGGMNLQTTTANRGWSFISCEWENNRGTDQVLITNIAGLNVLAPYIEMPAGAAEAAVGMEFDGCTGSVTSGFITAADANNKSALQFKANCDMSARNNHFGDTWATSSIDVQGSILENRNNIKSTGVPATYTLDSTAQLYGDICPRVSANKGTTDQSGIVTATPTKVTFGTKLYDETNCYATSTYTPQTKRKQRIQACVKFNALVDQTRVILMLYANGASFKSVTMQASGTGPQSIIGTWEVDNPATNTTWEIYVRQDSGGNQTISGAIDETYFMAECS